MEQPNARYLGKLKTRKPEPSADDHIAAALAFLYTIPTDTLPTDTREKIRTACYALWQARNAHK